MTPEASRYRYRAARTDGRMITGVIDAVSEVHASSLLVDRGLYPVKLARAAGVRPARRPARRRDLAVVFRAVAALVEAGVPIERALGSAEPLAQGALRGAVADAGRLLREGRTLAQGLEASGGLVPPVIVGMVRAGEHGGRLGPTLADVADHLEQEAELASRVRQALAYPLLVAVAGTASILVIATVVIPRFAAVLTDLGQELPAATRLLLGAAAFTAHYGLALAGAGVALVVAVAAWRRTDAGRSASDALLLRMPVLGAIRHALATSRSTRALGLLLEAGMPLLPALRAAADAAGDAAVAARVHATREAVAEGRPLAMSLERTRALTPSALQLLAVGEGSGRLGAMAARAGVLAAREAERALRTAIGLIEPLLIIVFGGLVAFVAMALLQAVYGLRPIGV